MTGFLVAVMRKHPTGAWRLREPRASHFRSVPRRQTSPHRARWSEYCKNMPLARLHDTLLTKPVYHNTISVRKAHISNFVHFACATGGCREALSASASALAPSSPIEPCSLVSET